MLKQNVFIALRSFNKSKNAFAMNLLSLSAGLTCLLFIYFWVYDEFRVDQFHEKGDRLLQVMQNAPTPDGIQTFESTSALLANALTDELPEVEMAVNVVPYGWFEGEQLILSDGSDRLLITENQFASKDFFKLFSFPLVQGDASQVLADVTNIALSESLAKKLFGSTDVLGQTVEWIDDEFGGQYKVAGVFKDVPAASTMQFDVVVPMDVFLKQYDFLNEWSNADPMTYLSIRPGATLTQLNSKLHNFVQTKNENLKEHLFARAYANQYLYGKYENGKQAGGRIEYVRLFVLLGVFILIIACVNFMTMTVAKATSRLKEIGVKKAMGAARGSLLWQYLTESIVLAVAALLLALVLVVLLLPQFSTITGKTIQISFSFPVIASLLGITLFTGVFAGLYPAAYLSGFNAVQALKAKISKNNKGALVRKALVVFQFAISTVLIVSMVIITRQIELIQTKNLGFDKTHTIEFRLGVRDNNRNTGQGLSPQEIDNFLQQIKNEPGVAAASNFAYFLGDYGTTTDLNWPGNDPSNQLLFGNVAAGWDFIDAMAIQMVAGRPYNRAFKTDNAAIIFNQTAIDKMGIADPIGKKVTLWGQERTIIGVTEDFNFASLYENVGPFFINLTTDNFASNIVVRLEPGNELATIKRLKTAYANFFINGLPFEFTFLTDKYAQLYNQEIRVGTLSKYAALVAVFISCLGLFGFATFTVERKLKEIAIRKTLGSTELNIVQLVLKPFLQLVVLSCIIALPIAYLLARNWLDAFAFRIHLEIWYFLLAAFGIMFISLLTVSYQTLKATGVNTVKYLHYQE